MDTNLRKTRFVCVSDTHNASPADGSFKLPKGDVLVHAGDLTKQGTYKELKKTLDWIEQADFEVKLVVAGNHDVTLDEAFYSEQGASFHNQYQDPQACKDLVKQYETITYLDHESKSIGLTKEDGPKTAFTVFGSPYSPRHGFWAFGYPPEDATKLWNQVPSDTDVLITHTPPKNHCDESKHGGSGGCELLRQTLWRTRPSLAICGHIHEGRGVERVLWDPETPLVKYREMKTTILEDPEFQNKKQSLFDVSSRSRDPLQNTGSWESTPVQLTGTANPSDARSPPWTSEDVPLATSETKTSLDMQTVQGVSPSGREETPNKCLGRKETCVINAAMMATSWPYKPKAGSRYNKPIVVDIDFPVLDHADMEQETAYPEPFD